MGVYPAAVSLLQYNTQIHKSHTQYTIHISHEITPLKRNKRNKEKQVRSQSYTNSEGHHTASEYNAEKGEEVNLSLIQALEAC
jgi:hypothetical protein